MITKKNYKGAKLVLIDEDDLSLHDKNMLLIQNLDSTLVKNKGEKFNQFLKIYENFYQTEKFLVCVKMKKYIYRNRLSRRTFINGRNEKVERRDYVKGYYIEFVKIKDDRLVLTKNIDDAMGFLYVSKNGHKKHDVENILRNE